MAKQEPGDDRMLTGDCDVDWTATLGVLEKIRMIYYSSNSSQRFVLELKA